MSGVKRKMFILIIAILICIFSRDIYVETLFYKKSAIKTSQNASVDRAGATLILRAYADVNELHNVCGPSPIIFRFISILDTGSVEGKADVLEK